MRQSSGIDHGPLGALSSAVAALPVAYSAITASSQLVCGVGGSSFSGLGLSGGGGFCSSLLCSGGFGLYGGGGFSGFRFGGSGSFGGGGLGSGGSFSSLGFCGSSSFGGSSFSSGGGLGSSLFRSSSFFFCGSRHFVHGFFNGLGSPFHGVACGFHCVTGGVAHGLDRIFNGRRIALGQEVSAHTKGCENHDNNKSTAHVSSPLGHS